MSTENVPPFEEYRPVQKKMDSFLKNLRTQDNVLVSKADYDALQQRLAAAEEEAEAYKHPTPCLICGKPVPGYVARYCCGGSDCGCMGYPLEPCVCSNECDTALMSGIGGPMEKRGEAAGIEQWEPEEALRSKLAVAEAGLALCRGEPLAGDPTKWPHSSQIEGLRIQRDKAQAREAALRKALDPSILFWAVNEMESYASTKSLNHVRDYIKRAQEALATPRE